MEYLLMMAAYEILAPIGITAIVVGPILLFVGVGQTIALKKTGDGCTETVQALVIASNYRIIAPSGNGAVSAYYPVFQYEWNGVIRQVESIYGTSAGNQYQVGSYVELRINPDNPSSYVVNDKRVAKPKPFLIAGGILSAVGIILAILAIATDFFGAGSFLL